LEEHPLQKFEKHLKLDRHISVEHQNDSISERSWIGSGHEFE